MAGDFEVTCTFSVKREVADDSDGGGGGGDGITKDSI